MHGYIIQYKSGVQFFLTVTAYIDQCPMVVRDCCQLGTIYLFYLYSMPFNFTYSYIIQSYAVHVV